METNNREKISEILLEILIGIFIILISVSVYRQYLKPFLTELQGQKRDPIRIRQLSSINSALNKLRETNPSPSLGEPNRVYISLPSSNANCDDLELPSLPDGWEYRCKPEAEYKKIDGQGWIPVDFTKLSDNSSFKLLPVDPVNSAANNFYYAYIPSTKDWVLVSLLGSNKFLKQSALNDGGTDPARFEIGSSPQLWAKPSGLVGYWKFDEGQGTNAADSSGQGNNGTLVNGPAWVDSKLGKALSFDGVDDYVLVESTDFNFLAADSFAISVWIKTAKGTQSLIIDNRTAATPLIIVRVLGNVINFVVHDGVKQASITGGTTVSDNVWHHIVVVRDVTTDKIYLYVDGKQDATPVSDPSGNIGTNQIKIGCHYSASDFGVDGKIDEVRIYNRALTADEIRAIYNATK